MLTSLTARVKSATFLERMVRYNMVLRPKVRRAIETIESGGALAAQQEIESLQNRVLHYAMKTPYGSHVREQLGSWPILNKEELRKDARAFLVPRVFGVPCTTSGSSGVPLALQRSLLSIAAEQVFIDHWISRFNVSFRRSKIAFMRGNLPPGDRRDGQTRFYSPDPNHLIISTTELDLSNGAAYIDVLKRFQPDVLWVYPTALSVLADILTEMNAKLVVPVILTGSEVFSSAEWDKVGSCIEGQIVDYYGQGERVCMAVRYTRDEWFFHPAYGRVELLPEPAFDVAAAGESYARIIATGFWNMRMPLVRYDTGDLIAYPENYGPEELGRVALGNLPFRRVVGRDSEYLLTSTGGKVQALNNIARDARGVERVQFIQHSVRMVEIRVRPNHVFDMDCQRELIRIARRRVPIDMEVSVVSDKPLRKTPSGKIPFVIREISFDDRT